MAAKPNKIGEYTEAQLEAMEIRELEGVTEAWSRGLGHPEITEAEIEAIRLANRIFVRRRERLRRHAPELLTLLKQYHDWNGWDSTPSGSASCPNCDKVYGFDPPKRCINPDCLTAKTATLIDRIEGRKL